MLSLDNVSVDRLGLKYEWPRMYDAIKDKNIKSVQDFVDFVKEHPEYKNRYIDALDNSKVQRELNDIIRMVNRLSKKGVEPEIYTCKEYKALDLEYNDELNSINMLPIKNPVYSGNYIYDVRLGLITVKQAKNDLGYTNCYGENQLKSYLRGVGNVKLQYMINALNMFTEQIERQAKLTDRRDINLFLYNNDEKREILREMYAEVITYLIYSNKELIWGKLSDNEKKIYLSSVFKKSDKPTAFFTPRCRENLINQIANYTTLPELEKMQNGNYNVLRRFMKKESNKKE